MSKLNYMYNAFGGKHILTEDEFKKYNNKILIEFLKSNDKFLLYDDMLGSVLLLNENDMRIQYKNGNYRDYGRLVDSFEDFCLSCCLEVLKEFSNYSLDEIKKMAKKHNLLKLYIS